MKKITTNTLLKGASLLFTLAAAMFIAVYAFLAALTAEKESVSTLACTAYWEIAHLEGCEDINLPEAGITIADEQPLVSVITEQFAESIIVSGRKSVGKILGTYPDRNEQLAATISFQYHEQDLGDRPEEDLIPYSSKHNEPISPAHYNSLADLPTNSIHLGGIEYCSLWATALSYQPTLPSVALITIDEGADNINMGQTPQAVDNPLKPPGSINTLMRISGALWSACKTGSLTPDDAHFIFSGFSSYA